MFLIKISMYCFLITVQLLSRGWFFATQWTSACQAPLSFIISLSLLKFMSIKSMMLSKHLILCCRLLLLPQSFLALGSFPMSQRFVSSGQSTGASAIVLTTKEQTSFNFMAAVTVCSDFGAQESKVCHCFHCFPIYFCHELMGLDAMIFIVWMLSFNPAFHSPFSLLSKGSLVPLHFLP